jgi:hypothetical protein
MAKPTTHTIAKNDRRDPQEMHGEPGTEENENE